MNEQPCVIFENDGEIDPRMISTFGCSVKESKNPIGFFGTGLKFAIAVLLRTGHTVTIQSGLNEMRANVKDESLRGKVFGFIHLAESALGFTTELGKTWEVWMAYRELHCNAKDEVGGCIYTGPYPAPSFGKTRVIVSGDECLKAHNARSEFILEGAPIATIDGLEIHAKPSQSFFYKGIKVMQLQSPALYTYNQTGHVELTEDRTVKDYHSEVYRIARTLLSSSNREVLESVLVVDDKHAEYFFDYHGWSTIPSQTFLETVGSLQRHSLAKLNQSALRVWREKGMGIVDPRRITPTKVQSETLERAIAFCEKSGFELRDQFPIIIVETLGEGGTLAMADSIGKQILLTERLFQQGGTKLVARALIEEYLHLRFKFSDCSREMQNFLFDKMVSLAEELSGTPL